MKEYIKFIILGKIEKYETISDNEFIKKNLEPLKLSELSEELSNYENRRKTDTNDYAFIDE